MHCAMHSSGRMAAQWQSVGVRSLWLGCRRCLGAGAAQQHAALRACERSGAPACFGGPAAHGRRLTCTARATATPTYQTDAYSPRTAAGPPRVCIIGGGFGGLYTAIKLDSLIWPKGMKPKVTLVDQSERFVFKPLLYELVSGTASAAEVAPTFTQLLAPYPIQFIQAKVAGVEPTDPEPSDAATSSSAAAATAAPAAAGRVLLASGDAVEYDWLVVALGAEPDPRGVRGVKEHAVPFATLEDAQRVNERLAAFDASPYAPVVVVVGAGYAGVELTSVIAERVRGRAVVKLVTPGVDILETSPEGQREAARCALQGLGVDIMTDTKVARMVSMREDARERQQQQQQQQQQGVGAGGAGQLTPEASGAGVDGSSSSSGADPYYVTSAGGGGGYEDAYGANDARCVVHLELPTAPSSSGQPQQWQDERVEADLVLWTAGSSPVPKAIRKLPFPATAKGMIETDVTLRVAQHPRVFALGDASGAHLEDSVDAAAPGGSGGSFPATAQVAFQQADYAAWNIWAAMNGRPLLPFRYQHLGDMMSLGAANAAYALPLELPESLRRSLQGTALESVLSLAGIDVGSPRLTLAGPGAQLLRRAAYLYRQPTNEQRLSVAASWVGQALDLSAQLGRQLLGGVAGAVAGGGGGGGGRRQ